MGQLDDKKVQMAIDKGFAFFDTDKSGFIDGNEACAAARKALSHTGPLGAVSAVTELCMILLMAVLAACSMLMLVSVQSTAFVTQSEVLLLWQQAAYSIHAFNNPGVSMHAPWCHGHAFAFTFVCLPSSDCPAHSAHCCVVPGMLLPQQKVTDDMIQGVFNKYAGPDKKMDKAEFGNCVAGLVERVGGPKAHTTTATTATHAAAPTGAAAAADTAVAAA
jgi:hypothetical protein